MTAGRRGAGRLLVLGISWLFAGGVAGAAHGADDAVEAAALANDVNQSYCGDAYSTNIKLAADATKKVADAWSDVSDVYDATGENYLLFWRGVLAQCLGRPEAAHDDLTAFLEVQSEEGGYADLVRQARARLRRLDSGQQRGTGPAADYLQAHQALELGVGYAGGLILQLQTCSDTADSYLNGVCAGHTAGVDTVVKSAPVALPAQARLDLAVYPARFLGLGGRFQAGFPGYSYLGAFEGRSPQDTVIGPQWALMAGPLLRFQTPVASGQRAVRLTVMPAFLARHERLSPLAGKLTGEQVLLHAGTYGWTLPGVGGWFELAVQAGQTAAVRLGGGGGICFVRPDPMLPEIVDPAGTVAMYPAPESLWAATGRFHLGLLFAHPRGRVAFAPALHVQWHGSQLQYPDDGADEWTDADEEWSLKVYSTQQHLIAVTLELGLRLGVPVP